MSIGYIYVGHGINQYPSLPNSSLGKCVSDVQKMSALMVKFGFDVRAYYDAQCTRVLIEKHWRQAVEDAAKFEKAVVFIHQSSHGTQAQDKNGDEKDGMDEAICCYDTVWNYSTNMWNNVYLDDDIKAFSESIPDNVLVVLVSDTCHSGDLVRGIAPPVMIPNRKFVYPRNWIVGPTKKGKRMKSKDLNSGFIAIDIPYILLAGTSPDKYSYENHTGGVLSTSIYNYISKSYPYLPLRRDLIVQIIRDVRGSGYDQWPHYECRDEMMTKCEFCVDTEKLKPLYSPEKKSWFAKVIEWFRKLTSKD